MTGAGERFPRAGWRGGIKIGEGEEKFLSRATTGIYVQANRYRSLCDSIQRTPILDGGELYTAATVE